MYIVLLKFAENKSAASDFMDAHNVWIAQGFADGVFQCVGSLASGGGAVIAHGEELSAFDKRVRSDPFVEHGVVKAEIHQIDPKRTVSALEFLKVAP